MPQPGLLTNRDELEILFEELATELDQLGASAEIVMVGGSWMLWHAHRAATQDVDSARRLAADLSDPISRVGLRHQLSARWLNDHAAAYWPADASFDECEVVFERPGLVVRAPRPDVVFVMKLYRADPQDREDMIDLWPRCAFATPEDAAEAFHLAYPHAPEDEQLSDFIRALADDAT